jgi:hypothetical protein
LVGSRFDARQSKSNQLEGVTELFFHFFVCIFSSFFHIFFKEKQQELRNSWVKLYMEREIHNSDANCVDFSLRD